MDAEEESILRQMLRINESSGQLATLMLTGEATREDQINFAHKLIDLVLQQQSRRHAAVTCINPDRLDGRRQIDTPLARSFTEGDPRVLL